MALSHDELRTRVFEADEYTCQICDSTYPEHQADSKLRVELVTPLHKGGEYSANNHQTVCIHCTEPAGQAAGVAHAERQLLRRVRAANQASTIDTFGDDALALVKIGFTIGSIGLGAATLASGDISPRTVLANPYTQASGLLWTFSIVSAYVTYYYCRLSEASPSAQETLFAADDVDEEQETFAETADVHYTRIALGIFLSIAFALLAIGLFAVGLVHV